jgi:GNAT superfamily N-acetyltransferase
VPRPRRIPELSRGPGDDGSRAFKHAAWCNAAVTVRPVDAAALDAVLPLIADYQRFYGVAAPDEARNRAFWTRFVVPGGDRGVLLGAYAGDEPVGFTTVYWTWESIAARDVAVLNDLFVADGHRGAGTGRALMEAAFAAARERGLTGISWMTALDNRRAQRLYETFDASRDVWFEYGVELDPDDAPGRT